MKKLASLLLSLVLVLSLVPAVSADTPEPEHKHCVCGATHKTVGDHTTADTTTFTKWTSTTSLPLEAGNYYLDVDVTFANGHWFRYGGSGETRLCLNGHKITFNNSSYISMEVRTGLTLTDCQGTGEISTTGLTGMLAAVRPTLGGEFTMFGGTLKGTGDGIGVFCMSIGGAKLYGGTITGYKYGVNMFGHSESEIEKIVADCRIPDPPRQTHFEMYGGTITGCTGVGVRGENTSYLTDFFMHGGSITGNTGVGVQYTITYMYGGTISGNGGGGIKDGIKNIYGGTITGNNKFGVDSGRNLYFSGTDKITIKDNFSDGTKNAATGLYEGNTQCNVLVTGERDRFEFSEADSKYLNTESEIGVTSGIAPTPTQAVAVSTGTASRDYTAAFFSDNPDYFVLNGSGNVVQLALLIREVAPTDPTPEAGEPLPATVTLPESVNYVVDSVTWTDASGAPITAGATAGEETTYTAKITLKLASAVQNSMRFAQGDALTIPQGYTLDSTNSDGTTVVLTKTFTTGRLPLAETAAVSGTPTGGKVLTAELVGGNSERLLYKWFRETSAGSGQYVEIPGATAETYTLTDADVGLMLRVDISAEDREGTLSSQSVGPIAPRPRYYVPTNTVDTTQTGGKQSPSTGDPGIAVYAVLSAASALGLCLPRRRKER